MWRNFTDDDNDDIDYDDDDVHLTLQENTGICFPSKGFIMPGFPSYGILNICEEEL